MPVRVCDLVEVVVLFEFDIVLQLFERSLTDLRRFPRTFFRSKSGEMAQFSILDAIW